MRRWILVAGLSAASAAAAILGCSLIIGDRDFADAPADAGRDARGDATGDGPVTEGGGADADADTEASSPLTLDPAFGEGGVVTVPSVVGALHAAALVDGGLLAAGYVLRDAASDATSFAVVSFGPSGEVDNAFGQQGIAATAMGAGAAAHAMAVQPDGKIVAVGTAFDSTIDNNASSFAFARYLPGGQLDTSFNTVGTRIKLVRNDYVSVARAVAVDPSKNVIAVGTGRHVGGNLEDKTLICALNEGGGDNYMGDQGDEEGMFAMAMEGASTFLAAGVRGTKSNGAFFVQRHPGTAAPDPLFDAGADFTGQVDVARGIARMASGFVVGGTAAADSGAADFAAARFLASGALDPAFNDGGTARADLGADDEARAIAVEPSGSILLAGRSGPPGRFAVVRFSASGSRGPSATYALGTDATVNAVLVAPNGAIYLVGSATVGGAPRFAVARLRP